jgi:DNA-binding MarR family transcriptional regulator
MHVLEVSMSLTNLDAVKLQLDQFVPFRLNRLAEAVSVNLSEIYRDRFGLEIAEWRVLVTVAQYPRCTAQFVGASTCMHKTRVSRALGNLVARRLVVRATHATDQRELTLQLSATGRRLYAKLVPLAKAREAQILARLAQSERLVLHRVLSALEAAVGIQAMTATDLAQAALDDAEQVGEARRA